MECDDKLIIRIHVPSCTQVCRCSGRIYDRNHDSDVDITDNANLVYQLYARKQSSYFVNKVYPNIGLDALRPDIIDRARQMTRGRNRNHPWLTMSDEQLLRSAGLILTDADTGREGITLAAILLFGKDSTIMSVLPQHKTDAIYRVENIDRYDDRDVIITNLFDTYDRLFAFARKHLNDPFFLDGDKAFSARDAILREIFSNILAHRDYSTGYVAKFVIEKDRMYTENGNLANGNGVLNFSQFEPFSKNPPIAKVFREVSLADELGSGMRNTYKYTKLYSGGEPQFIEGDLFRTIIPLKPIATAKVGPVMDSDVSHQENHQVSHQENHQEPIPNRIIDFCSTARSKKEIAAFLGYKDIGNLTRRYISPLVAEGIIKMTEPDNPTSRNQKYIKA